MRRMSAGTVFFIALLILVGAWLGANAQESPPSHDAAITRHVEDALGKDPLLRSLEIYVETQDGVVKLSGFVRSLEDIAKAGALAGKVRGVSAVRNGLRVANRPSQA